MLDTIQRNTSTQSIKQENVFKLIKEKKIINNIFNSTGMRTIRYKIINDDVV